MEPPATQSVTYWLQNWRDGDDAAMARVIDHLYRDLRRMAQHYLSNERPGHTLQPTALVHEMYLEISSVRDIDWKGRGQFIMVAAQMMRRILIDHARRRSAAKRTPDPAPAQEPFENPSPLDVIAVDRALTKMLDSYPRHARLVELKIFGGLDTGELAQVLEISPRTAERDWRFAKAWLQQEIAGGGTAVAD